MANSKSTDDSQIQIKSEFFVDKSEYFLFLFVYIWLYKQTNTFDCLAPSSTFRVPIPGYSGFFNE